MKLKKVFISETTGPIGTKLCLVLWWPLFIFVSGNPDIQPTWPLLLKSEKVDAILIVFLLNYWANHGFKLCQNNPLLIPFQNFVWHSRPRAKISGRCYYLLMVPCTSSGMQGFTCLIKSYKTNMLRLFQWNTVRRRI